MAGWCRPESVPLVTSSSPLLPPSSMLSSFPCWSPSFPLPLTHPCPLSHLLLFSCFPHSSYLLSLALAGPLTLYIIFYSLILLKYSLFWPSGPMQPLLGMSKNIYGRTNGRNQTAVTRYTASRENYAMSTDQALSKAWFNKNFNGNLSLWHVPQISSRHAKSTYFFYCNYLQIFINLHSCSILWTESTSNNNCVVNHPFKRIELFKSLLILQKVLKDMVACDTTAIISLPVVLF